MSSIKPFITSTRDPRSFKLRNPQLSSKESERLDTDNYKMEAKLRELKQSMKRQKQERENMHSDGSIWSSGKPGAVTTHATDLMRKEPSKPAQSKGKARKIKVLKDTPLDLPKRTPIAASFSKRSPPKFKGPACGQCEQKAVALTCMECGENYCTTCFAKFHLKGALKNHRSIPYQINSSSSSSSSLDLSNGMTPSPKRSAEGLPPRPPSANRRTTTSTDTSAESVKTVPIKLKDPSEMTGGAFLQGTFSEEESASSFAQALAEWRAGKENGATENPPEVKKVESIASGTSTEEPEPIEIIFNADTSITYADKLLIKKHRRTELSPLPSPRLTSPGDEDTERHALRHSGDPLANGHADAISDDEKELKEEHERYVGIFNKSGTMEDPRLESALSIIEVTEDPTLEGLEVEPAYSVEEVDDSKVQSSDTSSSVGCTDTPSHVSASSAVQNAEASPQARPDKSPATTLGAAGVSEPRKMPEQRGESASKPARTAPTPSRGDLGRQTTADKKQQQQQQQQQQQRAAPQQPAASAQRLASARPAQRQPPSRERILAKPKAKSAGVPEQRQPPTHEGESPVAGVDPASGRLSGLTSAPSGMLVTASHLVRQPLHHYKAGLGEFFLAGLGGEEEGDHTREDAESGDDATTPVNRLPECSYKGALPAWRPDSSFAAAPPLRESLQPFSPSPPPKSGRQSHRVSAAGNKARPVVKPPADQAPPSVQLQGPSAKVREDSAKVREDSAKVAPRRDADNTISWRLSRQGQRGDGWNDNNNGTKGDEKSRTGKVRSTETAQPDRSSSRIEVDGDDMTVYDNAGKDDTEVADQEMLEKLTWELASQSGRITADGRLTSMSLPDDPDDGIYRENSYSQDDELGIVDDNGLGSGLSTPFDFVTGQSISPAPSEDDDAVAMEMQRYTAEVESLN